MTKNGKSGFVFQIWRSFILFILVPIVLLNVAIFYMLYDMENTTKSLVKTRMEHARFLLDQDITDSLALVDKLGNNYNIQRMASLPRELSADDYGTLWKIKDQGMSIANDAYSINILCNGNDIFMTDNSLCIDLSQFYPSSYAFGNTSLEELKEYGHRISKVSFHPFCRYKSGESWRNGIFYTTVMTPYAGESSGATAIVFFNEENLQGILGDTNTYNGLSYIMDSEGLILYQTGNEELSPVSFTTNLYDKNQVLSNEYFGKDNFSLSASLTTGLQIVFVIPESSLHMQMGSLKIFIWILNCMTIIMCLSLSLIVAKRRGKMLSNTLELMNYEGIENSNAFSALYDSVSTMVDTNSSLKHALGAQKELLQSVFWNRVLSVNSMSDEEIRHLAKSADIRADAHGYCLMLIGFGNENDLEAEYWEQILQRRKYVLEEMERDKDFTGYIGKCGMDQLVLLIPLSQEQCKDYQNYVVTQTSVLTKLMKQDAMMVCVGSVMFGILRDIYSAYTVCSNQMNLCSVYLRQQEIIWCSEENLDTETTFYYTDELKNQIVLWIKTGQQKLVKEGIYRILDENYIKQRISKPMEQLLIAKLKLTLLSSYDSRMLINLPEVLDTIDGIQTDALLISYILRVAQDMCNYYMKGIRSHEEGLQKKIVTYIDKHFTDYGFGLGMIAEYCNLSEAYFSQIFKEIFGENFSTYVEKKRMTYAYQLIIESDMILDLVAEKTGYSNTNAFRKAYKRFYGISPSQSRKNRPE